MSEDREHEQTTRRYVAEIVALESDLVEVLDHQQQQMQAHSEAAALVQRCREIATSHRGALQAYLERLAGDTAEPPETAVPA